MAVRVTDSYGLVWKAGIDDGELNKTAARIERRISGMGKNVQQEGDKMNDTFKKLVGAAVAFFTLQQGSQLVNGLIKVRGEFQQLEIAFGTMLGSKEKADKLMAEAVDLAAKTPFGLQDVASGAKQLLAYGFSAESLTENIKMLGNVASGVGSQIGDLIYLYGTLNASGRVTQMDINQFAGRGIPIYKELSNVLGVTVEKVRELVGGGGVKFSHIEKAFQNMTKEGGMFYNLMEAQSASLTGQISNLQDAIASMFNEIGKSGQGVFSSGIQGLNYLVENYKEIGKILAVLITTYGAYRAALILTSVTEAATVVSKNAIVAANLAANLSGKSLTATMILQAGATEVLTAASAKLTAVLSINPLALIATAVAAATTAYFLLRDATTATEKAAKDYKDIQDGLAESTNKVATETKGLVDIINSTTSTRLQQIESYEKLQALYPELLKNLTLEEFKMSAATEQQKAFNDALDKSNLAKLESEFAAATDKATELKKEIEDLKAVQSSLTTTKQNKLSDEYERASIVANKLKSDIDVLKQKTYEASLSDKDRVIYYRQQVAELEKQIHQQELFYGKLTRSADGTIQIKDNLAAWNISGLLGQFNSFIVKLNGVQSMFGGSGVPFRNLEAIDKDIEDVREKMKTAPQTSQGSLLLGNKIYGYDVLKQKEQQYLKERDAFTGKVEKSSGKNARAATKSADEQKRAIESITEADRKATIDRMVEGEKQVAEIKERFRKMREEAAKAGVKDLSKIDALEKQALDDNTYAANTKAVQEYLENQKKLYEEFEDYKAKVGEETARKEFESKIDLNTTYYDILKKAKENFEADQKGKKDTNLSQDRSLLLNKAIADEEEKRLQKQRDNKAKIIEEENKALETMVSQATDYYSQRTKLDEDYAKAKTALLRKGLPKNEYEKEFEKIKGVYTNAVKDLDIENSALFKSLSLNLEKASKEQIENVINVLDEAINSGKFKTKAGETLDVPPDVLLRLKQYKEQLKDIVFDVSRIGKTAKTFKEVGEGLAAIGQALSKGGNTGAGEIISNVGSFIIDLEVAYRKIATTIGVLKTAMKAASDGGSSLKNVLKSNDWIGLIVSIINVIAGLFGALKRYKEARAEMQRDIDAYNADIFIGEFKITEQLREQNRLHAEALELTKQQLAERRKVAKESKKQIDEEAKRLFEQIQQGGEYITAKLLRDRSGIGKLFGFKPKEITFYGGFGSYDVNDFQSVMKQAGFSQGMISDIINKLAKDGKIAVGILQSLMDDGVFGEEGSNAFKKFTSVLSQLDKEGKKIEITFDELKALDAQGLLQGGTKALFDQLVALEKQGADVNQILKDIADAEKEIATGTTWKSIADSIVSGFENGKRSAADFADDFETMMRKAMLNSLRYDAELEGGIKEWYNKFAEFSADGVIDAAEKGILNLSWNDLIKKQEDKAKMLEDATGISLSGDKKGNKNTLSGAISAASQESIDLLAGHTMGMRVAQLEANNYLKGIEMHAISNLELAAQTATNTGATVIEMKTAVAELKSLNKKIQSGSDVSLAMGGSN